MKIIFMGTPDIAKQCLEAIYLTKNEIIGVVTTPDKQQGRGMNLKSSPVKQFALNNNIKVYQPEKIKNNENFVDLIKSLNPDVICVVAYGKILNQEILDIPQYGCINVHASLLPQYRGSAPIQWAVLNGDKKTGITTMYMDSGIDTGDIILKEEVEIGEDETTGELWEKLAKIGAKLLVKTLNEIEEGTAKRIKQPLEYTSAPMIDKQMARIDWENQTADQIKNLIRGLNPFMGAYTFLNNKKVKIWKSKVKRNEEFLEQFKLNKDSLSVQEGTPIIINAKQGLFIKAKDGIIEALEVQGENSKRMPAKEYLRGNSF